MTIFVHVCAPNVGTQVHTQQPHTPLAWVDFGWALMPMDVPDTFLMLVSFHPPTKLYHPFYRWGNWGWGKLQSHLTGLTCTRGPSLPSILGCVVPGLICKLSWPAWWLLSVGFPRGTKQGPWWRGSAGFGQCAQGPQQGQAGEPSSWMQEEVRPPRACFLWLVFQGHIHADFEDKELSRLNFPKERFPNNKNLQRELWRYAGKN